MAPRSTAHRRIYLINGVPFLFTAVFGDNAERIFYSVRSDRRRLGFSSSSISRCYLEYPVTDDPESQETGDSASSALI